MRRFILPVRWVISLSLIFTLAASSVTAAEIRPTGTTSYALELNGAFAGWLDSVQGGMGVAEVLIDRNVGERLPKKFLGQVRYEELTLQIVMPSTEVLRWVQETLTNRTGARREGAVILVDRNFKEQSRLIFNQALLSEATFPKLDAAASKNSYKMTLKIAPETTRISRTSAGSVVNDNTDGKQQRWLTSNFRLTVKGMNAMNSRVNSIEAFTITQKIVASQVTDGRGNGNGKMSPGALMISDLSFSVAEAFSSELLTWYENFVIKGMNSADQERTATIELLDPSLKKALFTMELSGLGIYRLSFLNDDAPNSEAIRKIDASMYVENVSFR